MAPDAIDIRLNSAAQLFQTLDPSPFREGDLAPEAEEYIIDCARELAWKGPLRINFHLPAEELSQPRAAAISTAVSSYFADRAQVERRQLRELFRYGRIALLFGLTILGMCLFVSWWLSESELGNWFKQIGQESFVIIGWVAIWRPAEIFLYEWIPIERRRRILLRLSKATVSVVPAGPQTADSPVS
jgi:hypothetical protein